MKIKHLLASVLTLLCVLPMAAQMQPETVPLDSAVRVGTLPNGLTYIIRHNEYPKGQAEFFIAQKVGSMLEEDNQRGLAHFLEHMAFNGTKQFPGTQLRDWLASRGVKFGRDLNAYTGFDETVYNISSVPSGNIAVEDSCLMILHDWAGALTLATDDINDERGVIEQEWRRSNQGSMRILEKALPELFPNNRYGTRLPIGTMDVVLNFAPDALRDYYRRWYRPDQQGIIVVGDIDVDRIEGKIKEMFADLSVPADAPERIYTQLPEHQGTIIAGGSDPEMRVGLVQIMFPYEPIPREMRNTVPAEVDAYVKAMITAMLNERLSDIASKPDAPFVSAELESGEMMGFVKTKHAFTLQGIAKEGNIEPVVEAVYRELLRAKRGGFTQGEYDRAKAQYLSAVETAAKNAASHPNGAYAREYVRYFIDNEPIPGLDAELQLARMLTQMLPLAAINQYAATTISTDDRLVAIMLPEKEGVAMPTDEAIEAILAKVDAEDIQPLTETLRTDPLVKVEPTPGTIAAIKDLPEWEAQEWTLGNGIKVIVKPTKFKEDQILLKGFQKQGWANDNTLSDADVQSMSALIMSVGAGNYSTNDIDKYLAGKNVRASYNFRDYSTAINGTTSVKDLPAMMELLYAKFVDPTIDADEYESSVKALQSVLANMSKDPQLQSAAWSQEAMYQSPKRHMFSAESIGNAKAEDYINYIKKVNSNAANYTFVIVGNVDIEALKPLVEKYIASLPADASNVIDTYTIVPEYGLRTGKGTDTKTMAMQTPQVYGVMMAMGEMPFTAKNNFIVRMISSVLTERLVNEIREKMGAVYSISAGASMLRVGTPNVVIQSDLLLKPELRNEALAAIERNFLSVARNVTDAELTKAKEVLLKDIKAGKEVNAQWVNAIEDYYSHGVDTMHGAEDVVKSITAQDIVDFCKALYAQGNFRTILLDPAE